MSWNFEELRMTSLPFSPPDLHPPFSVLQEVDFMGCIHRFSYLLASVGFGQRSHWQDMGGKKKNEIGVFTSLDSSLLGHCGMLISSAKATLLSTIYHLSTGASGCPSPCHFRPGDSDSLWLLLTPGAYAIPIPFLNDSKRVFLVYLFSVTQLNMPSVPCWYSDIEAI